MKIKYLFLAILATGFLFIVRSTVGTADTLPCAALLHSLESKVGIIKDRGGIWGMFDKNYKVRIDSKSSSFALCSSSLQ